jgi:molybdate transport system permease protein
MGILRKFLGFLTGAVVVLFILLMTLPLISLAQFSGFWRIITAMQRFQGWDSVRISLETTAVTAVLMLLIGTPVAFVLSRLKKKRMIRIAGLLCQLPISLPPSVAGIALLLLFGKNGMAGRLLAEAGIQVVFTPVAVVIAQFFVACPLFIQLVRTAADQVPEELYEAALVNGADHYKTIAFYIVPMLRTSVVSGLIIAYIRALGEFGATLLFAGNMTGITSTMPLHIYTLMESDVRFAAAFSLILLGIAAILVVVIKSVFGREK